MAGFQTKYTLNPFHQQGSIESFFNFIQSPLSMMWTTYLCSSLILWNYLKWFLERYFFFTGATKVSISKEKLIEKAQTKCKVIEEGSKELVPCSFPFVYGEKKFYSCTDYLDPNKVVMQWFELD